MKTIRITTICITGLIATLGFTYHYPAFGILDQYDEGKQNQADCRFDIVKGFVDPFKINYELYAQDIYKNTFGSFKPVNAYFIVYCHFEGCIEKVINLMKLPQDNVFFFYFPLSRGASWINIIPNISGLNYLVNKLCNIEANPGQSAYEFQFVPAPGFLAPCDACWEGTYTIYPAGRRHYLPAIKKK